MGDLLTFRRVSSAAPQIAARPPAQEADIVFFTGVRYQRAEPAAPIAETSQTPPGGGLNGAGGGKRRRRG